MSSKWKESYAGKTVLVTGGAGAVGGCLVQALAHVTGVEVVVLDDLSGGFRWRIPALPNIRFLRGSVTDTRSLQGAFRRRPEVIFHLAALFANQRSVEYPELDLCANGLGTLKVLQSAVRHGASRVIFAGSSSVNSRWHTKARAKSGGTPPRLTTPYQITKLLGEFYCEFFSHHHGLVTVRPRLFNSYGPGDIPGPYRNVIPNFIRLALENKPLPITGSGEETRDFTFVEDIVEGLLRLGVSEAAANSTLDLGTGVETRIADLAALVNEVAGNGAGVQLMVQRKWDQQVRRLADLTKARAAIDFSPGVTLKEGLVRTVEWFHENGHRINASSALQVRRNQRTALASAGFGGAV